jgi:hypothetical protein
MASIVSVKMSIDPLAITAQQGDGNVLLRAGRHTAFVHLHLRPPIPPAPVTALRV